jgi:hypothetical protein
MSEEKFLAFKGLKQYDPGMGWASVHNFAEPQQDTPEGKAPPTPLHTEDAVSTESGLEAALDNARMEATHSATEVLHDPLLGELFEQLHQPPKDELAQSWKLIAQSVNLLSQRMAQQRELREHMNRIEQELDLLRQNILHDLKEIQRASDSQLSMARLRAEVSSLAQTRLSSRLRQTHT